MGCQEPKNCRFFALAVFGLTLLLNIPEAAFAQGSMPPALGKWRPRDGTYAIPGKDFSSQCGEFGNIIVELAKKSISGHEWSCGITKLTDTAPDAVKLEMTCNDYNLAQFINPRDSNAYEKKFKEILLVQKTGEKTIFVRKTENGKFAVPGWHAAYCPDEAQRSYKEAQRRDQEEKRTKAAAKQTKQVAEKWLPKDGVYATPGVEFDNRCVRSDDIVLGLAESSVSNGGVNCNVFVRSDTPPGDIHLEMICNGRTGAEFMRLRKIDDTTIFLMKTKNGTFIDEGGLISYCGEEVQRAYSEQKTKK